MQVKRCKLSSFELELFGIWALSHACSIDSKVRLELACLTRQTNSYCRRSIDEDEQTDGTTRNEATRPGMTDNGDAHALAHRYEQHAGARTKFHCLTDKRLGNR